MSISSLSLSNASRVTILRLQSELKDANTEISTGRYADVGQTLGRLSGTAVSYHSQETTIQRMLDSNQLVMNRLDLVNDNLDAISQSASSVYSSAVALAADIDGAVTIETVIQSASASLQSMMGALNTNTTGQYLFAGAQTDLTPMKDGTGAVSAAFQSFVAAAGHANVSEVTADELTAYFSDSGYTAADGTLHKFSDNFSDTAWSTNWSNASDTPIQSRISKNETIESSVSANEAAFRNIAAAYSMLTSIGIAGMSNSARQVVANQAASIVKKGVDGLTALQAEVGTRQSRVELANTALTQQQDIVKASIERLEGVDASEASLRITALETQLEASYTVTGRLQNLSILNYL